MTYTEHPIVDLKTTGSFIPRHLGPGEDDIRAMLKTLGFETLDELTDATIPESIRLERPLEIPGPRSERDVLRDLRVISERNRVFRSFIGQGYTATVTPPVIQRNILENPAWYTQYTPYQAEIAQGRLELLLHFQTMIADLTGLPVANASLLDESTAAAEAMTMAWRIDRSRRRRFFADELVHPQTLNVLHTRAEPLGIELIVGPVEKLAEHTDDLFGVLVQDPATDGRLRDLRATVEVAHATKALVVAAAELYALTLITPPGEWGADIAVGSSQRFGMPMGAGGPHAAFIATREEYARQLPGRIVGVSRDAQGRRALRLALQTREQHIRRDKATSNICTAQVLPAIVATAYAIYHGPDGLRNTARRMHGMAVLLAEGLRRLEQTVREGTFFDTVIVEMTPERQRDLQARATERCINFRYFDDGAVGITLDETNRFEELHYVLDCFTDGPRHGLDLEAMTPELEIDYPAPFRRTTPYLTHETFARHTSEHEMLRYLHNLQGRDLSLAHSMIPLGSCTMKLNATSQMLPITWREFTHIHPYAPADQQEGYGELCRQLESWLGEITGLPAVSLQPNAGAQGEYAGLLAIRGRQRARGQTGRNICLIPTSAHGTNPASAVVAGFEVVPVACDADGNIDLADLEARAAEHAERLGAIMVTYPSTHGVFETAIKPLCEIVHRHGGLVYMDGANMNAQVGLARPGDMGADVVHLNLHKTFCIPHGGGGPGMGPIAATEALRPYLPGDPLKPGADPHAVGPIAEAAHGSAIILAISWTYIALMGNTGLRKATQVAILNANYMAHRLREHYDVLYSGPGGRVAHEFIIDLRRYKKECGIDVEDVAKRLMDFGFHAPTMSWPVPGTLMIEPTESEPLAELERYIEALAAIRAEIDAVARGELDREDNPLKHAPHTSQAVTADEWPHAYSRTRAAWPRQWLREHKFWPPVGRIDNPYGDRNLVCTCAPPEAYAK